MDIGAIIRNLSPGAQLALALGIGAAAVLIIIVLYLLFNKVLDCLSNKETTENGIKVIKALMQHSGEEESADPNKPAA